MGWSVVDPAPCFGPFRTQLRDNGHVVVAPGRGSGRPRFARARRRPMPTSASASPTPKVQPERPSIPGAPAIEHELG